MLDREYEDQNTNEIRGEARVLRDRILDLCPNGRSLALTKLEEAFLWAKQSLEDEG